MVNHLYFNSERTGIKEQNQHSRQINCDNLCKCENVTQDLSGMAIVVGGGILFSQIYSFLLSQTFFSERHCTISPLHAKTHTHKHTHSLSFLSLFSLFLSFSLSLCSHTTVIQSELVEIHMHAFQKGWGVTGEGGRREGGW